VDGKSQSAARIRRSCHEFVGSFRGGRFLFNNLRHLEKGGKRADKHAMSSSPINLNNNYLQSILSTALQGTGLSPNSTSGSVSATSSPQSDNGQLSPFAQLMNTLQQLQQSNPTEYKQVTQQIATNLQNAAQAATSSGNTTAANQLTQLSTDFTNASQSGQLPNISDLAQAVGGGGHHHHHHGHHASSSDSSSDSSSSSSSTTATSSTSSTTSSTSSSPLDQLLAAFQANSTPNESLNPMAIIMNTLNSAGITASNS
jgi:hypothetical protein